MGWIVAAVVIVAAGAFYFWPNLSKAPATTDTEQTATTTSQTQATSTQTLRDPMMSGTWQSNSDAKFTREFRADGVVYDRYKGDATAGVGGSWEVVDPAKESALLARATALAGVTVIKAMWEDGAVVTYFSINKLDEKSMTITDLSGRGGVTVFTKI